MRSLTKKQLNQFQELYFKHFGVRISEAEALEQGLGLLRLMKVLTGGTDNERDEAQSNT